MAFLQQDIEKIRSRLEGGTISLNETRRLEEKKVEDLRNEDRKQIEERVQAILSPVVHFVIDAKKDAALATDKNPKKKKATLEESADGEAEGVTDAVDLAETLELREGLRIMTDWLSLSNPGQSATIAKDKNPANTTSVK
jgi:hypothetical protein